jgi:hypothetical protein
MSNKRKKSSVDLPTSAAAASGHDANQQDLSDEKITVQGEQQNLLRVVTRATTMTPLPKIIVKNKLARR